ILTRRLRHAQRADGDLFGEEAGLKDLATAVGAAIPDAGLTLRLGRVGSGLTSDPKREMEVLFQRFVKSTKGMQSEFSRTDLELWAALKKKVQPRALDWLTPRPVQTREVDLRFDHSFVNGKIHAVQPLSFDFLKTGSISEKAARWVGFGVSLDASGEMSKVY